MNCYRQRYCTRSLCSTHTECQAGFFNHLHGYIGYLERKFHPRDRVGFNEYLHRVAYGHLKQYNINQLRCALYHRALDFLDKKNINSIAYSINDTHVIPDVRSDQVYEDILDQVYVAQVLDLFPKGSAERLMLQIVLEAPTVLPDVELSRRMGIKVSAKSTVSRQFHQIKQKVAKKLLGLKGENRPYK